MEHAKFPIFRKYTKQQVYFRIESEQKFTELNLIGEKLFSLQTKVCSIYPDRMFVQDLIHQSIEVEELDASYFDTLLRQAEMDRVRI